MKSLGSLIVLFLFAALVQAGVTASIDKLKVKKGESVTLTLAVSGERHTEPEVTTLCNTAQIERDHRQKPDSLEGTFREVDLYSYRFAVDSDCLINPILVEVDGVEHYTPAVEIEVQDKLSERPEDTVVSLNSSTITPYVGEAFDLEITLREPTSHGLSEVDFVAPVLKDLWIKKVYDVPPYKEGVYRVKKRLYRVTPQRVGLLHIDPVEVKLANDEQEQDAWGNPKTLRTWESLYTKALNLDVKAIPPGVQIVGDFTIEMNIDATTVEADMPIKAELVIQGQGNFEDISLELPVIEGVKIITEEPLLENAGDEGHERWRQRLAFVSDHSFVVPSVTLSYFDLEEKEIKRIHTDAVAVDLLGQKKKDKENVTEVYMTSTKVWRMGLFAITLLLFILLAVYYRKTTAKRYACNHDYKEALRLLLRHKDEEGVLEMVESLERHIYGRGSEDVDLKKLKVLCKKYA